MKKIIFYYMIMENGKVFQGHKLTAYDPHRFNKHMTRLLEKRERCSLEKSLCSIKPFTDMDYIRLGVK